ncbi:MAG TPA: hypothetical protein PLC22_03755 [Gordonia sp. (in: high G+C Gram-positive bacteria)]|nr:hypothetical protein [Gordonia sp. (in: high G+C Gram-positive bacteria)]
MVGISKPEVPVEVAEQLDAAIRFSEAADIVAKQAESRRREAVLAAIETGVSQSDVGRYLGLTPSRVNQIIKNRR